MITFVHDYKTADGYIFRVEVLAFSQRRLNSSKKHQIRLVSHNQLTTNIAKLTVDQFVQEVTIGKMGADLLADAKKIASLRHIGIKKTKLISTPKSREVEEAKQIQVTTEENEQTADAAA